MPFPTKPGGGTAAPKTPTAMNEKGSFVGYNRVDAFDTAVVHDGSTTNVTVSVHVRHRASDVGMAKAVLAAFRRGDKANKAAPAAAAKDKPAAKPAAKAQA